MKLAPIKYIANAWGFPEKALLASLNEMVMRPKLAETSRKRDDRALSEYGGMAAHA